jgi:putative membrane protein (TIGR04086 family)
MKTGGAFTDSRGWEILKTAIIAIIFSLILILLFALIIKISGLSNQSIAIFDQVIKIISIFFGCFIGFKNGDKCWLKGILAGFLFALMSFLIFAVLGGEFNLTSKLLYSLMFNSATGCIVGFMYAYLKAKRR